MTTAREWSLANSRKEDLKMSNRKKGEIVLSRTKLEALRVTSNALEECLGHDNIGELVHAIIRLKGTGNYEVEVLGEMSSRFDVRTFSAMVSFALEKDDEFFYPHIVNMIKVNIKGLDKTLELDENFSFVSEEESRALLDKFLDKKFYGYVPSTL